VLYLTQTAVRLPSLLPGHQAGSAHHHIKHAPAALGLALLAWTGAWLTTGNGTQPPPDTCPYRNRCTVVVYKTAALPALAASPAAEVTIAGRFRARTALDSTLTAAASSGSPAWRLTSTASQALELLGLCTVPKPSACLT
jgi:hypothetical protein